MQPHIQRICKTKVYFILLQTKYFLLMQLMLKSGIRQLSSSDILEIMKSFLFLCFKNK